jgi:uncharacterized Zn-binding protein involved in type VI secretion
MPAVARKTDQNAGGGIIQQLPDNDFVRCEGLLVSVDGSMGSTHPPAPEDNSHTSGVWKTAHGSSTVRINGKPVNRAQDADTCQHARKGGSPSTRIGDGGGGDRDAFGSGAFGDASWR